MIITVLIICVILVFADYTVIKNDNNMTLRSFMTMAAADAAVVLVSLIAAPVMIRLRKQ